MLRPTSTGVLASVASMLLTVIADYGTYTWLSGIVDGGRPSVVGLSTLAATAGAFTMLLRWRPAESAQSVALTTTAVVIGGFVLGNGATEAFVSGGIWPGPRAYVHRLAFGVTIPFAVCAWMQAAAARHRTPHNDHRSEAAA